MDETVWTEVQRDSFVVEGFPHTTVELRANNGDVKFLHTPGTLRAVTS